MVGIFDPACQLIKIIIIIIIITVAPMDEGTILVYCCPSTFSLTSPPPSQSKWVWGGGGGVMSCVVDHILQEFNTPFLTRFRTYKIATPPQTKITSKDDI